MAYVTRCPYCGSVWLVPDKETADRTPLKCPDCRHSFDATCSLLKVPDELFPGRTAVPLFPTGSSVAKPRPAAPSDIPTAPAIVPTSAIPAAPAAPAPHEDTLDAAVFTPRPVMTEPKSAEEPFVPVAPTESMTESPLPTVEAHEEPVTVPVSALGADSEPLAAPTFEAMPSDAPTTPSPELPATAPVAAETEMTPVETPAVDEVVPDVQPVPVQEPAQEVPVVPVTPIPEPAPAVSAPAPVQEPQKPVSDDVLPSPALTPKVINSQAKDAATALSLMQTPNLTSEPRLGNLSGLKKVVAENEKTTPIRTPRVTTSAAPAPAAASASRRPLRTAKKKGATASLILVTALFLVIAAVAAVVFNQKVMEVLPQTAPYYNNVCRTVPCPGFYLHDINAFAVSKAQLRPLDESGNYALEVVVLNGSETAQAVPYLQIELVDDNDGSLLRRTLAPEEYLDKGQKLVAIAPQGQLTVRINLQTNVTSARCIVTPLYP